MSAASFAESLPVFFFCLLSTLSLFGAHWVTPSTNAGLGCWCWLRQRWRPGSRRSFGVRRRPSTRWADRRAARCWTATRCCPPRSVRCRRSGRLLGQTCSGSQGRRRHCRCLHPVRSGGRTGSPCSRRHRSRRGCRLPSGHAEHPTRGTHAQFNGNRHLVSANVRATRPRGQGPPCAVCVRAYRRLRVRCLVVHPHLLLLLLLLLVVVVVVLSLKAGRPKFNPAHPTRFSRPMSHQFWFSCLLKAPRRPPPPVRLPMHSIFPPTWFGAP